MLLHLAAGLHLLQQPQLAGVESSPQQHSTTVLRFERGVQPFPAWAGVQPTFRTAEILRLSEQVLGEVEAAVLPGPSVVAREVAELPLDSRGFSKFSCAWATLGTTASSTACLTDASDILQECSCQHYMGNEPQHIKVNRRNQ
ncbi:hypothetical protein WJX74_007841 [Apatococcus lobatus]|uniref:Uncharacterized protein n=1 Tax=Apatococcus lobatus TaxID=904363 RepID=A0AAW1RTU1_9CHLO